MIFKNYDEISETYDSRYTSDMSLNENEAVKRLLHHYINDYSKVLDIGCGTGFSLDLRRVDPQNYIGVDISTKMLKEASRKYPTHVFFRHDMRNGVLSSREFDIALSLFSVPYIGIGAIPEIKRSLRNGGVFIVVYYNKPYLNHDSVYYNHRLKYHLCIKPRVKRFMKVLRKNMKCMQSGYLTKDETYCYAIFKEYKKNG